MAVVPLGEPKFKPSNDIQLVYIQNAFMNENQLMTHHVIEVFLSSVHLGLFFLSGQAYRTEKSTS